MKNFILSISILIVSFMITSCGEDDAPQPAQQSITAQQDTVTPPADPNSDKVKFTLYSNRVPYIWKRVVNGKWVQDSIKTNSAIVYEPYDTRNMGIGYFVTFNTSGQNTDVMSIRADYNGKVAINNSVKGLSFAFVKLDDLK